MGEPFDRDAQRKLVRRDQTRFWGQILGFSAVSIAMIVVAALAGIGPNIVILPAVLLVTWAVTRRPREQAPGSDAGAAVAKTDGMQNIAFSIAPPTWTGWRRDVGLLRFEPGAVRLSGVRSELRITDPVHAEVTKERWGHWPFVKLSGCVNSAPGVTVYLGVRGYPRSKVGTDEDAIRSETSALCAAVNAHSDLMPPDARHDADGDDGRSPT